MKGFTEFFIGCHFHENSLKTGYLLIFNFHKSLELVLQVFGILEDFKESTDIFSDQCPRCFIGTLLDWK